MAKKTTPKSQKTIKKVTRRRRKTPPAIESGLVIEIEQVYKVINRIQLTKEGTDFIIHEVDSCVVENILRDAGLAFTKTNSRGRAGCKHYRVQPPKKVIKEDRFDDFDEFPDEIIEDGQIFF